MKAKKFAPQPPTPLLSPVQTNLIAGLLILCFAAQALWHARVKSVTFDESGHITFSYLMFKTDRQDYDTSHPPMLRYLFALPLWLMDTPLPSAVPIPTVESQTPMKDRPDPQLFHYAALFIFQNEIPAETLLFWPRAITVAAGCFLGLVIFLWTRKLYGDTGAILSLTLFAFCPNLIAHFSLITTDAGGTAFAVFFLYTLFNLIEKPTVNRALYCGIALGLALLSKFTNLFLVGIFLILYPLAETLKKRDFKTIAKTILCVGGISWLVVCVGYRFENVFAPHALPNQDWLDLGFGAALQKLIRWTPLPQNFMHGILYILHHSDRGHGAFLLGQHSSDGWWYYFPAAILLKTPTFTLALIAVYLALLPFRKIFLSVKESGILSLIAIVLWSGISAHLNIGIRHILLIYPLTYILLGQLAKIFPRGIIPGLLVVAGVLLSGEVLLSAPHYLAFFNRAAGGPEKGIDYLSDSNIDWGQDLSGLARFIKKEGNPELVLSYFGTGVPPYYGLKYQSMPSAWTYPRSTHINSTDPGKEYLAISVTNLQGTYFVAHDLFQWLRGKKPVAKIGYSIYVYDITNDLDAQERISGIYRMNGNPEALTRSLERIAILKKKLRI